MFKTRLEACGYVGSLTAVWFGAGFFLQLWLAPTGSQGQAGVGLLVLPLVFLYGASGGLALFYATRRLAVTVLSTLIAGGICIVTLLRESSSSLGRVVSFDRRCLLYLPWIF